MTELPSTSTAIAEPRSASLQGRFPRVDRRVLAASLVGGALATAIFAWLLFLGRAELTGAPTSNFYDLQARALLDGRWDISEVTDPGTGERYNPLSIEAIVIDGRSYIYYGPVPALLRIPVLLWTTELDGKLTQPSMMLAFIASLISTTSLGWRVRVLVRGEQPVGRQEALTSGIAVFAVGAGTVLLYLGSQPVVYHEAELWGVAFSLAALAALVRLLALPSLASVSWVALWTTLAVMTRASVGIGPLAALALLGATASLRKAGWRAPARIAGLADLDGRQILCVGMAVLLPVAFYAGVNLARFDTPFRLPLEKQVFSDPDCRCGNEQRIAALEANGGSIFGADFVPTAILQYSRPDALDLDRTIPWVTFPRRQATVVGDAVFDTRDEASSIPASMPAVAALGLLGLVAVVRGSPGRLAMLRLLVLGAAAGCAGVLAIAFIAHRYLADFMPLGVLCGLAGLHSLLARPPARFSHAVLAGLALAATWGVVANLALAIEYQRVIAPLDLDLRWDFLLVQHGDSVERPGWLEPELPDPPGPRGALVPWVREGSCSVWWTDGFEWYEVPDASCEPRGHLYTIALE